MHCGIGPNFLDPEQKNNGTKDQEYLWSGTGRKIKTATKIHPGLGSVFDSGIGTKNGTRMMTSSNEL